MLSDPSAAAGTWPFLLLLLPSQRARDLAMQRLWTSGLGVSRLFIHALPDYAYLAGIVAPAEVPQARDFAARSMTITNSLWLDDASFARICAELERALASA